MTKEFFLTRLAFPVNLIGFAWLLLSKSTNITLWLIFLVFIFGQAVYHLYKKQNNNVWTSVVLLVGGLVAICAYVFFV